MIQNTSVLNCRFTVRVFTSVLSEGLFLECPTFTPF
jgi:hypothetical protein